jgi:hypothetical protein
MVEKYLLSAHASPPGGPLVRRGEPEPGHTPPDVPSGTGTPEVPVEDVRRARGSRSGPSAGARSHPGHRPQMARPLAQSEQSQGAPSSNLGLN